MLMCDSSELHKGRNRTKHNQRSSRQRHRHRHLKPIVANLELRLAITGQDSDDDEPASICPSQQHETAVPLNTPAIRSSVLQEQVPMNTVTAAAVAVSNNRAPPGACDGLALVCGSCYAVSQGVRTEQQQQQPAAHVGPGNSLYGDMVPDSLPASEPQQPSSQSQSPPAAGAAALTAQQELQQIAGSPSSNAVQVAAAAPLAAAADTTQQQLPAMLAPCTGGERQQTPSTHLQQVSKHQEQQVLVKVQQLLSQTPQQKAAGPYHAGCLLPDAAVPTSSPVPAAVSDPPAVGESEAAMKTPSHAAGLAPLHHTRHVAPVSPPAAVAPVSSDDEDYKELTALLRSNARRRTLTTPFTPLTAAAAAGADAATAATTTTRTTAAVACQRDVDISAEPAACVDLDDDDEDDPSYQSLVHMMHSARKRIRLTPNKQTSLSAVTVPAAAGSAIAVSTKACDKAGHSSMSGQITRASDAHVPIDRPAPVLRTAAEGRQHEHAQQHQWTVSRGCNSGGGRSSSVKKSPRGKARLDLQPCRPELLQHKPGNQLPLQQAPKPQVPQQECQQQDVLQQPVYNTLRRLQQPQQQGWSGAYDISGRNVGSLFPSRDSCLHVVSAAAMLAEEIQQRQQQQQGCSVPKMPRRMCVCLSPHQAQALQQQQPPADHLQHVPACGGVHSMQHLQQAEDWQQQWQWHQPQHPNQQLQQQQQQAPVQVLDHAAECAAGAQAVHKHTAEQHIQAHQQEQAAASRQQLDAAAAAAAAGSVEVVDTTKDTSPAHPTTAAALAAATAPAHMVHDTTPAAEPAAHPAATEPINSPPQQQQQQQQRVLRAQQHIDVRPEDLLLSRHLGSELVDRFRSIGHMTHDLHPWQAECLLQPGVAAGQNLVFSAPTSAGKSLVAKVLLLQHLQQHRQHVVLLVLPLVELCAEMADGLEPLLQQLNKEVMRSYGGLHSGPVRDNTGVIVCTVERANSVVGQLLSEGPAVLTSRLGLVIVDELHMVGDQDRGHIMEMIITKIRYCSLAARLMQAQQQQQQQLTNPDITLSHDTQCHTPQQEQQQAGTPGNGTKVTGTASSPGAVSPNKSPGSNSGSANCSSASAVSQGGADAVRVVGMSATMPNIHEIALWLDAQLYVTDYRPVPLHQWVKVGSTLRDKNYQLVRELPGRAAEVEAADPDHVALLTQETVQDGHSVLIFVARREDCIKAAAHVTNCITIPTRRSPITPSTAAAAAVMSIDQQESAVASATDEHANHALSRSVVQEGIRDLVTGLKLEHDRELQELVRLVGLGAGVHHAGLPKEIKSVISRAFSTGAISLLCATTSLAYGVNLPARRVIFKHAYKAYDSPVNRLTHTEYLQMSGRAGRAGIDTVGEAILIEDSWGRNHEHIKGLLQGSDVSVSSCLGASAGGMSRALLEVIAAGVVASSEDVERFLQCSLLQATYSSADAAATIQAGLKWLYDHHLIRWDGSCDKHVASDMGRAAAASGLALDLALRVKQDVDNALRHLCVCDAHILYLATPNWNLDAITPNWNKLYGMCARAIRDGDQRSDTGQVLQFVGLLKDSSMQYIRMQAQRVLTRQKPLTGQDLSSDQSVIDTTARRFWGARMLVDIVHEVDDEAVALTWLPQTSDHSRPRVQVVRELRERAHGFASLVANLCTRLSSSDQRYSLLSAMLTSHQRRVYHGVKEDVLALTEIKHVKGPKARMMFEAGIKTAQDVVEAGVDRLLQLFLKLVKADVVTGAIPESRIVREKQVAANIIKAARELLASKGDGRPTGTKAAVMANSAATAPQKAVAAAAAVAEQEVAVDARRSNRFEDDQQGSGRPAATAVTTAAVPPPPPPAAAAVAAVATQPLGEGAAQQLMQVRVALANRQQSAAARRWPCQGSRVAAQAHSKTAAENVVSTDIVQQLQHQACAEAAGQLKHQTTEQGKKPSTGSQVDVAGIPVNPTAAAATAVSGKHKAAVADAPTAAAIAGGGAADVLESLMTQPAKRICLERAAVALGISPPPPPAAAAAANSKQHDQTPHAEMMINPEPAGQTLSSTECRMHTARAQQQQHVTIHLPGFQGAGPSCPEPRQEQQQQQQQQRSGRNQSNQVEQQQQQQEQSQKQQQAQPLRVEPGITVIRDVTSMQRLTATLAAADCWSFALHLNPSDSTTPLLSNNPDISSSDKHKPSTHKQHRATGNSTKASSSSKAAATVPPKMPRHSNNSNSGSGHKTTSWRWPVLGVSFSTAVGCVWYVPLTTGDVPGDAAVRVGTSRKLASIWEQLSTIFSRSSSGQGVAGDSCTRVPAVAAAAAAYKASGTTTTVAAAVSANDESFWLSPRPVKVTYALKPQLMLLANPPVGSGLRGISVDGCVVDVRVAAWLVNPDSSKVQEGSWTGTFGARHLTAGLSSLLASTEFGCATDVADAVEGLHLQQQAGGSSAMLQACQRASMALQLHHNIMPQIKSSGLLPLLLGIEMPLVKVLASMESTGICISRQILADQIPGMVKRMDQLAEAAAVYNRGQRFDLVRNSKGTLSSLLFGTKERGGLGLQPPVGSKRNSSGRYSTAQDVLSELAEDHPLPSIVLKYRKLNTLHGHLLSRLQHAADVDGDVTAWPAGDGLTRISGEWMQTNSSSGRLSMGDFSLQCIPKAVEYEIESTQAPAGGQRATRQAQSNIRAGFVAPPGHVLLAADYNQIELRLMAHFSGEQALLDALRQGDPLRAMAANWLHKPATEVTESDRSKAKQIAYGLIYGMGSGELGKRLGCGELEARAASDDFKRSHPVLMKWIEEVKLSCRQRGYMSCLSGRRRLLPTITSKSYESRGRAERRAVNGTCQGSAADVVKGVMVELAAQIEKAGLADDCKLLVQVHDELLFEVSDLHLATAAELVKRVMEAAARVWSLKVPLPVKLSSGPSWGELQPYGVKLVDMTDTVGGCRDVEASPGSFSAPAGRQ